MPARSGTGPPPTQPVTRCRNAAGAVGAARLPRLKKWMAAETAAIMRNAPLTFAPEDGIAYFENRGLRTVDVDSVLPAAN